MTSLETDRRNGTPPRGKSRFQYSLRSLFILMTVTAIALSYVQWRLMPGRALQAINQCNGFVGTSRSGSTDSDGRFVVDESHDTLYVGPEWSGGNEGLRTLWYLTSIEEVHFSTALELHMIWSKRGSVPSGRDFIASDETLVYLRPLRNLRVLDLDNTGVTDAGLRQIQRFSDLLALSLRGTQITDAGIGKLQVLGKLRDLDLTDTRISDSAIERLSKIKSLEHLALCRTAITEAGLGHLEVLPRLVTLDISGTTIDRDAVERVRRRLPHCLVVRDD